MTNYPSDFHDRRREQTQTGEHRRRSDPEPRRVSPFVVSLIRVLLLIAAGFALLWLMGVLGVLR